MKKLKQWFKEHDLIKILLGVLIIAFILSWIIPGGKFNGATFEKGTMYRLGLDDLFRMPFYYALNSYLPNIMFFLVIGAFYGVLSRTNGYRKLVAKTAKSFSNKPLLFVLIASLVFTVYASISLEVLPILIFAPFVISVILKLGLGKVVGVAATFGASLIGVLGTTYGNFSLSFLLQNLGIEQSVDMGLKFGILVIAYALYALFMALYIHKVKGKNRAEEETDKFLVTEVKNSKAHIWPVVLIFSIIFIFIVLGYIDYAGAFKVNIFVDFNTWLKDIKLGDLPIISTILGSGIGAFGTWDINVINLIIMLITILLKFMYHIKFDVLLENAFDGVKKMLRPALFVILCYTVYMFGLATYYVPTMVNFIENLFKGFNPIMSALSCFVATIFHSDFGFTGYVVGAFYAASYTDFTNLIAIIYPSINGLASLIVPTSVILMAGLSYADISYKSWLKFIWKFFATMLVILLLVFIVIAYL